MIARGEGEVLVADPRKRRYRGETLARRNASGRLLARPYGPTPQEPTDSSQRSQSIAAMQPVPDAVMAWR